MVLMLVGIVIGVAGTLVLAPRDNIQKRRMQNQRDMYEHIITELRMDKAALLALLETRKR